MRVHILLVAILSLAFAASGGAAESEGGRYVAGTGILIWCSAEPHSPVDEPECTGADAYNLVNELAGNDREALGIGGFVVPIGPEDASTMYLAAPIDDVTGANVYLILEGPLSESSGERDRSEGCGPQLIWIPADPVGQIIGRIPAMAIDDDLNVCGATTGKY